MAAEFLLSFDQGTTGSTVLVIKVSTDNSNGAYTTEIIGRSTVNFEQHFPRVGWVEHDLEQIWASVSKAARQAVAQAEQNPENSGFTTAKIAGIGVTNQRETTCVFDRKTSKPLAKAIVWQCKRSTDICERLRRDGLEPLYRSRTGLVLDPYFSGSKIAWLLENNPEVASAIRQQRAVFGTIDTYLMNRLSGGTIFATEASNASRTLLFNIKTRSWDLDLLKPIGLMTADVLPEVLDSAGIFGATKGLDFLPDGIKIAGCLGDQQAALAGQSCFEKGSAKCTYGTGAFFLLNTGDQCLSSAAGLLTTVAWSLGGKLTYAFEGASFIAGAAVQYLRDQLGIIAQAADTQALAEGQRAAPDVYFVPALAGLGAPHWDPRAQGALLGLTRGTTRGQVVRATLEGIAFEVCDLVKAMKQDFQAPLTVLRVDGGATANDLLMQIQADLLGLTVDRPKNLETTAFGAAMFAGLGLGLFKSLEDLKGVRQVDRIFAPDLSEVALSLSKAQHAGWTRAVRAVQVFADKSL